MRSRRIFSLTIFTISTLALAESARAQPQGWGDPYQRESARSSSRREARERALRGDDPELHFYDRKDSLDWARAKALADKSTGFRVIVSLQARHLWVVSDDDTLLSAPVAVAKGTTLNYAGREYRFTTPRGLRTVINKDSDPIWNPPDWLYVETAKEQGLEVARVPSTGSIRASDGRKITVQNNRVGVVDEDGFAEFPLDLHVIVGGTLYIPPMGTENRRVSGTLGKYKLNLGDGYMLHGTPDKNSIGLAATHGCVRLRDEDIEWLFDNVPVGSKVYIY